MNTITIQQIGITNLNTDAIVNAANEGLWAGGGVCGAIFRAAGHVQLEKACLAIGHCDTGSAVITPGFNLNAKYIIHAVGPVWHGGDQHEPQLLYGAYRKSLELAVENSCHSIGFPLISAGIFGYPKDKAWRKAIQACQDFFHSHPDADLKVVFAVLDDEIMELGQKTLADLTGDTPQIARIRHYEQVMDKISAAIAAYQNAVTELHALQAEAQSLSDYYSGSDWKQDFADDEAERLPVNLKRGVLSEDGIYDLLEEYQRILKNIEEE